MKLYKYYLMERPPGPGCQPGAGLFKTEDYGYKRGECMGGMVRAWGRCAVSADIIAGRS